MDYCLPCRRHLNGALACPGCGTSAEEIRAQQAPPRVPAQARHEARPELQQAAVGADPGAAEAFVTPAGGGRAARRKARGRSAGPPERRGADTDVLIHDGPADPDDVDPDDEPAVGTSRRDRKAAAHRRRRRRTLLISTAALLAAAGLSLAELGVDAPFTSSKPAATGDDSADGGASAEAGRTAKPADGKKGGDASSSPSASASVSPSASESKDTKDEDKPSKDTQSATTGANPGTSTTSPSDTTPAQSPTATSAPTTSAPSPDPSPSCTRFLWWCT
ncbi:hypothetical protein ABZ848_00980 [Streptomyces sp. NPDC047081]|uniref:SCO2400 family protein n=1 Tax=Streptomyces sp. NPDC047081 TaxID=3154706 RepID=UPI003402284D